MRDGPGRGWAPHRHRAAAVLARGPRPAALARSVVSRWIPGALPGPLTDGETPLGISVGVATVTDPHADVMELLEIADRELYAVKPGGRRR